MPPTSLPAHDAFVGHLQCESLRFREVLATAPANVRVPTCPEWDADDLLWHLGEVQWFWGEIVERRLTSGEQLASLDEARVTRPAGRAGLLAHFDLSSERLQRQLRETQPETELWMWADDHSAAYIARRQAHEALIHRLDAELTAGSRSTMDPALCSDGVDEALRVMRGVEQDEALVLTRLSGPVVIACTDFDRAWTVVPTHVTGTECDGSPVDVDCFVVRDGDDATASALVSGTAADLDCWLWNRPVAGEVRRLGDRSALGALDRVVAASIT